MIRPCVIIVSALIFIDTNVLLDFYRVRGRQGDLSILDRIDDNRDRIITTSQVEMEFKKNRQRVIHETLEGLKNPKWDGLALPTFLARSKQSSGLDTGRKKIDKQLATLRDRCSKVLSEPTRSDPVYKVSQRLFRARGEYHLHAGSRENSQIVELAEQRFTLGYPPQKRGDTSIGDAINWEWIIKCSESSGADVVIVSRDNDYGQPVGKEMYLNDWLRQEFGERVSKQRNVHLTQRLAEAFSLADVPVTDAEAGVEEELLKSRTRGLGEWNVRDIHLSNEIQELLNELGDQSALRKWAESQKTFQQQLAEVASKLSPSIELPLDSTFTGWHRTTSDPEPSADDED